MKIQYFDTQFDVPDFAIQKYVKDFNGLPGSGDRESVLQLRNAVDDILDAVTECPEILEEPVYLGDFVRALAMRQAMGTLGLLHDA
jgi:hypothetical protein